MQSDDLKNITGAITDELVKDQMISFARNLSQIQNNDGRLAYASLLLSWVLEGGTEGLRYRRFRAISQAHASHMSDLANGVKPGHDASIVSSEFMVEVQKFLEFLS